MSNNFHTVKHHFLKSHELETFSTRKSILREQWRDLAVPESVQSCFELSIHFPVFFPRELLLVAVHGWFAMQTNVWTLSGTATSLNFFS